MTLPTKNVLSNPTIAYFSAQGRADYAQYIQALDALVAALAAGNVGALKQAANDAAAARAGVGIGQIYRSGSALQVRVV
jgi:hypothetical protein